VPASERLVLELDVRPGERVLDVAGGAGNTALAAARRDARTVCTDFVPELLEHAARRAEIEELPFTTQVADAQALPFPDASFDVVTSTFGVIFAPDQQQAASEVCRVLRPGGRLGLSTWPRDSAMGGVFELVARFGPPAMPLTSPLRWGVEDELATLLGRYTRDLRVDRYSFEVTAPSYDEAFARFLGGFGPVATAMDHLNEAGQQEFTAAFRELWSSFNRTAGEERSPDGNEHRVDQVVVPHDYLQVISVRR
jgi:SAM-dependent methyltransferase